jgi:hypothetical protein
MAKYEVTMARLSLTGRVKRTQVVEAKSFVQNGGTATFVDGQGRPVATIKHVVRVCWS